MLIAQKQALTVNSAHNSSKPWTPEEEDAILRGSDTVAVALRIGRTYAAVCNRRAKLLREHRGTRAYEKTGHHEHHTVACACADLDGVHADWCPAKSEENA